MYNLPGIHNYQHIAKKYLFDLLQEKYSRNQRMIERLSYGLSGEQDVKDFVQIAVDSFESGYLKAVKDYKDQLKKIGYEVQIVSEKK